MTSHPGISEAAYAAPDHGHDHGHDDGYGLSHRISHSASGKARRRLLSYCAATAGAASLALGSFVALAPASSATTTHDPAFLQAAAIGAYGEVLTDSHGFTVYGLSTEGGGKIVCKATCLKFWPPVLVSSSQKTVSLGAGVTGQIGFVARSATTKQVTFDGYPLYTFVKDTAPRQSHGEGVVKFGGTWELVRASDLVVPSTASKTASHTTTTTAASSGYSTRKSGHSSGSGSSGSW